MPDTNPRTWCRLPALAVILALASSAAAESKEDKREDGTLAARYAVDSDGQRNGRFQGFSANGKQALENATYEHGQLNGMRTLSDEHGRLLTEETWVHGRLIYPKSQRLIQQTIALLEAEGKAAAARMPLKSSSGIALPDPKELAGALTQLKIDRYLCDVPFRDLAIDAEYTDICQHAAVLLDKLGHLDHTPKQPAGMDEAFFRRAYEGTSHSNLSEGTPMADTPNGYLDDSDPSNIDRVGHRRWVLSLRMGKVGFGAQGRFSAMYAFDESLAAVPDLAAISFPPRGLFPLARFQPTYAWHFSPLPGHYADPKGATATIWPVDAKLKRGPKPLALDYQHTDLQGFGACPAIIFRPKLGELAELKAGASYEVEIAGLTPVAKDPATVSYIVTFF